MAHARGALQISVGWLLESLRLRAQQAILAPSFAGLRCDSLAFLFRHVFIFLAPRFASPFAQQAHYLAAAQPIIISRGEHDFEPMILGTEDPARLVGEV